jgi:hypothetical protein
LAPAAEKSSQIVILGYPATGIKNFTRYAPGEISVCCLNSRQNELTSLDPTRPDNFLNAVHCGFQFFFGGIDADLL